MRARLSLATIVAALSACGGLTERGELPPEGQVVFAIATDAWLPPGPDEARGAIERPGLFEKLRVELIPPGERTPCRDCFRDFAIDHRAVETGKASVGFLPQPGASGYRVRVRLYHSGASESSAEPRPTSSIEVVAALPPVPVEGIVRVHVVLHTDDIGRPRGTVDAPIDVLPGEPPRGLAGTWHADLLRACGSPPKEGEACVPGGAYWQGDPGFNTPYERLVAVSPFFIDVREVSVAEVRATRLASLDTQAGKADPYIYSDDANVGQHYCTYTFRTGDKEDMPCNCISRELAQKVCEMRGASLPTDAQFEFVAGARRGALYPWGEGEAGCEDAIWGRTYELDKPAPFRACASHGVGVAKVGSGKLDRVRMGDVEVVDLAANLAEWVRDTWQADTEPCKTLNPAIDHVCTEPSTVTPNRIAVRGSPWTDPGGSLLRAAARSSTGAPQNIRAGFRCARPDE
jgi:formylglycine-generating enzyme